MDEPVFDINIKDGVARIALTGKLDATRAPALQDALKTLIGQPIEKIAFMAHDLDYIASAGLRVIIFAKQRIGAGAQVYLVGAQAAVLDVIRMSGLDTFMTIQDEFDA